MAALSKSDILSFYRDEIKHEFNLLAMRSTILVTCQSFLVVPFAILQTAASFRTVYIPTLTIALLGIFTVLILLRPLRATHHTIDKWLLKQRALFQTSPEMEPLALDRDLIPGADRDFRKDRDHVKSIAFSRFAPWAFFFFWIASAGWSSYRVLFGM